MPDLIVRGLINKAKLFDKDDMAGAADNFGVEWIWNREAGGSMEVRGSKFMEDANDWRDLVTFPDVDP